MVIKLKKFSKNPLVKAIAFILTVIGITGSMVLFSYLNFRNFNFESLFVNDFKSSDYYNNEFIDNELHEITAKLLNHEEINYDRYYYYCTIMENQDTRTSYNAPKSCIMEYNNIYSVSNGRVYSYQNGQWIIFNHNFELAYGQNTYGEYGYDEIPVEDNTSEDNTVEENTVADNTVEDNTIENNTDSTYETKQNYSYSLLMAFNDSYLLEKQKEWEDTRHLLIPYVIVISVLLLISILMIICLINVTGRKYDDKELYLKRFDKIYSDIQILILLMSGRIWIRAVGGVIVSGDGKYYIIYLITIGVVTAFETILCGIILLSLVRKIKAKLFFKHSLLYKILYKTSDFIKSFFDDRRYVHYPLTKSLNRRQTIFIAASVGFVFLTIIFILMGSPLLILPPITEVVMIYWFYKENQKTYEEINKGFQDSLEDQLKSERMKIDLVTNVSHDLKTPLTSIITYVDLLSKEELSETSRDYVNILKDKSNRLKNIVSDLFDLAKSTSGNMPIDLDNIDLKKLVEQTLADMEDQIISSELQFKTKLPESPIYIHSDGKKLYRVFQNIIDNTLKYSLIGSRVYIDMVEGSGKVIVVIRNTSASEINFTAEEILQRFNRGDKSRTTEGSGLGLSIAESFTHVCGGRFKLDIDGDLFKVTIEFDIISN